MTTPEDHDLEEDWKDLRPDPVLPPPGAKMSPEDILNVAKALTGKDSPKFFELAPDRLQNEATTESGLIVPRELTDPPMTFQSLLDVFLSVKNWKF